MKPHDDDERNTAGRIKTLKDTFKYDIIPKVKKISSMSKQKKTKTNVQK